MSKRLSNNNRYGDRKLKLSRLEPERLLLVMRESQLPLVRLPKRIVVNAPSRRPSLDLRSCQG